MQSKLEWFDGIDKLKSDIKGWNKSLPKDIKDPNKISIIELEIIYRQDLSDVTLSKTERQLLSAIKENLELGLNIDGWSVKTGIKLIKHYLSNTTDNNISNNCRISIGFYDEKSYTGYNTMKARNTHIQNVYVINRLFRKYLKNL